MKNTPLRVIGTPDSLVSSIKSRAERDLGFSIQFEPLDGIDVQQRAVVSPESFDVMDHWSMSAQLAWVANALQTIDVNRISEPEKLLGLGKSDAFWDVMRAENSNSPGRKLFVQPDGTMGENYTENLVMMPTLHNFDSFGVMNKLTPDKVSWGVLFDPKYRGKVALTDHAPIAIIEAALSAKAIGKAEFKDIGNLRVSEIDTLIDILIDLKRRGQFAGFWEDTKGVVDFVKNNNIELTTIWFQGISQLRGQGIAIRNASPIEGYRGWLDGLAISCNTKGIQLDRAYEFLNWWQSGWPGAIMARMGVYMTRPDRVRRHLSEDEWQFWYEGQKATRPIVNNSGQTIFDVGQVRDGGSYKARLQKVAVWNTFMDEHNYIIRKWQEFMSA